jgi:hypothetical protein
MQLITVQGISLASNSIHPPNLGKTLRKIAGAESTKFCIKLIIGQQLSCTVPAEEAITLRAA